jgi:hypothetical protein
VKYQAPVAETNRKQTVNNSCLLCVRQYGTVHQLQTKVIWYIPTSTISYVHVSVFWSFANFLIYEDLFTLCYIIGRETTESTALVNPVIKTLTLFCMYQPIQMCKRISFQNCFFNSWCYIILQTALSEDRIRVSQWLKLKLIGTQFNNNKFYLTFHRSTIKAISKILNISRVIHYVKLYKYVESNRNWFQVMNDV